MDKHGRGKRLRSFFNGAKKIFCDKFFGNNILTKEQNKQQKAILGHKSIKN